MAQDFSFDVVSKVDEQELENAINQAVKEISQRFDFKGSKSQVLLNKKEKTVELIGDDEFKLNQVKDVVHSKLVKRGISLKALTYGAVEPAAGGTVRQIGRIVQGIPPEAAKELVKYIKQSGAKVQTQIQGDQLRISSRSKDALQAVIASLRALDFKIPLQFTNYR